SAAVEVVGVRVDARIRDTAEPDVRRTGHGAGRARCSYARTLRAHLPESASRGAAATRACVRARVHAFRHGATAACERAGGVARPAYARAASTAVSAASHERSGASARRAAGPAVVRVVLRVRAGRDTSGRACRDRIARWRDWAAAGAGGAG